MNLVDRLKASYSFLGDPLHREAYEEIERLRHEFRELHADISMFMKDGPLKQDLLEDIMDVLVEGDDEKRTLD